jgi:phage-related tail fiber protein
VAARKITDLTALTTPTTNTLVPVVDLGEALPANQNKKLTLSDLTKGLSAATTGAAGVVQLSTSTSSTSTTLAATPSAVKTAYDLADAASTAASSAAATASAALPLAGGTMTGAITFAGAQPTATTSAAGIVQLNNTTASTSTTLAATANAVKTTYDLANAAIPSSGNFTAKAWVTFNGTGTVAIIASQNVTSITDNGAGNYGVNFTTAMPDADYAVSGSGRAASTSGTTAFAAINIASDVAPTTSAVRIRHVDQNTLVDGSRISVVIHS